MPLRRSCRGWRVRGIGEAEGSSGQDGERGHRFKGPLYGSGDSRGLWGGTGEQRTPSAASGGEGGKQPRVEGVAERRARRTGARPV